MISKKQKKLKWSMLVVLLLLMPSMLYAACTGSSPTWTTTPDYASVAACVAGATAEDTINVTAGSGKVTWASQLVITKGINLIGPGRDNLTIKSSGTPSSIIQYSPSTANFPANYSFRLSGFTFDSNGTISLILGKNATGTSSAFTRQTKVRVDHNKFINTGSESAGAAIFNYCTLYGVVDNNIIDTGYYPIRHSGAAGIDAWWVRSPQNIFNVGDANFMFFEDNTIIISSETIDGGTLTNGQYSARYVFRYNNITNTIPIYAMFDLHGYQPSGGMDSCFGAELYGNKVTSGSNAMTFLKTRAGQSMVFFNDAIKNTTPANTAYTGTTSNPCPTDDLAAKKVIHDNYWFNNRQNKTGNYWNNSATADLTCAGRTEIPKLGRDIFSNQTTIGVGCGTSLPQTCTVGQGYWVTNQSCYDLSGMVGANPSTPISGTLYKCTSTNKWEPYYTPYTYPHPLRNSTTSYTENPQSPVPTVPETPMTTVPPTIAVSPTTKDFGSLPIYTSSPVQKFTVTTSGGNLSVDAISMTGTDAKQFTIQNNSCTGSVIAPETGSCTFDVKFTPSSIGAKTANVYIVDNDSNTTKLIALNGTGTSQVPAMSFSPTSLFFSGVLSGTLSSPKTITLSNTGASFVTISSLILSGTNANQFSIPAATDYCTGETVAASGNCSFQIIFSPTSGGEKTANVNLTALYYGSPAAVPIYGAAVVYPAPKIKISRKK